VSALDAVIENLYGTPTHTATRVLFHFLGGLDAALNNGPVSADDAARLLRVAVEDATPSRLQVVDFADIEVVQ